MENLIAELESLTGMKVRLYWWTTVADVQDAIDIYRRYGHND